jgi:hypothetical protein
MIALNILLVLAIAAIGWQARERWRQAQIQRREHLNVAVKPVVTLPLTPTPRPDGAQAIKYVDVATKNLFSKDRNPAVIVDPPKVEKPKPMPSLPLIYAVLGLPSGTRAIMAENRTADSRPVRKGDTVGEFKIVSLDPVNVVFDWDGQQISRKIDDLIDRSGAARAGSAGPAAAAQPGGPAVPAAVANNQAPVAAGPGQADPGKTERPCVPGDNSPSGTVAGGYRKVVAQSPFGPMGCHWIPSQ